MACQIGNVVVSQSRRIKLFLKSSLRKAAELSGVAGEFRCQSLHRSQISEDL